MARREAEQAAQAQREREQQAAADDRLEGEKSRYRASLLANGGTAASFEPVWTERLKPDLVRARMQAELEGSQREQAALGRELWRG